MKYDWRPGLQSIITKESFSEPVFNEQQDVTEFLLRIFDEMEYGNKQGQKTPKYRSDIDGLFQLRMTENNQLAFFRIFDVSITTFSHLQDLINTSISGNNATASRYLLIHTSRVQYQNGSAIKIFHKCIIPPVLFLISKNQLVDYSLKAFITHIGTNPVNGHYVIYIRYDHTKWLCINDSVVYITDMKEFEKVQGDSTIQEYMQRFNIDEAVKRAVMQIRVPYLLLYEENQFDALNEEREKRKYQFTLPPRV